MSTVVVIHTLSVVIYSMINR